MTLIPAGTTVRTFPEKRSLSGYSPIRGSPAANCGVVDPLVWPSSTKSISNPEENFLLCGYTFHVVMCRSRKVQLDTIIDANTAGPIATRLRKRLVLSPVRISRWLDERLPNPRNAQSREH